MKHAMKRDKAKRVSLLHRASSWLHAPEAKCALLFAVGSLILAAMFCLACAPERYHLDRGDVSYWTITATKDVTDTVTTEALRDEAAAAVEPIYHSVDTAQDEALAALNSIFDELAKVQQFGQTLRLPTDTPESFRTHAFDESEIEYARKLVTLVDLTRYQIITLLRTETEDFDTMVSTVNTAVMNAYMGTIRQGQESETASTVLQIVGFRVNRSLTQSILTLVLKESIKPNMVIEQEATAQAQNSARNAVGDVIYKQGQTIIRKGDLVMDYQIEMLSKLGLLEGNSFDVSVYAGSMGVIIPALALLALLLTLLRPEILRDFRRLAVVMSVLVVSLALSIGMIKLIHVYLAPIALSAMLLTVLLGWRAGLPAAVSMTLMVGSLAAGGSTSTTEMVNLLLVGMVGSCFSVWYLNGKPQRVRVVVCGVIVSLINAALIMAMLLMTSSTQPVFNSDVLWAAGGGLLSGIAALGLQPVMEGIFNLATPSKLLELGNQNHPLLRRLMIEAPGTYHHSMIVANLAEAAAEKIGANALLARTGAYFHDVGKLKRPHYFKENQMGENPLEVTDPYVSAAIVTSHTRDGLQLAQKHRLPPEIQQIVAEHHGDTPVMFFYHKALQQADGKGVDIDDFRYDGTRPATKEAAIVMLADTIEAAVRSMNDPTPQAIEEFIERLVRGKLEDGQLSNSPLTLSDIDDICDAFVTVLNGAFHERIEYPQAEIPKRGFAQRREEEAKAEAAAPETTAQAAKPAATAQDDAPPTDADTLSGTDEAAEAAAEQPVRALTEETADDAAAPAEDSGTATEEGEAVKDDPGMGD